MNGGYFPIHFFSGSDMDVKMTKTGPIPAVSAILVGITAALPMVDYNSIRRSKKR